jgi:hypothetical protein
MGNIGVLAIFILVAAVVLVFVLLLGHRWIQDAGNNPGAWGLMSTNDQAILVALVVIFWPAGLWYYWKRGDELRDQDTPSQ